MATYLGKSPARLAIITDDTITSSKILDNTITSADILNATITGADLASDISFQTSGSIAFGDAAEKISGNGTDLKIESSGKIVLDADSSGTIQIADNNTQLIKFFQFSNFVAIESMVSNKDLHLRGNDNGSFIDALSFDMSEAGAATFNSDVTAASVTLTPDLAKLTINSSLGTIFEVGPRDTTDTSNRDRPLLKMISDNYYTGVQLDPGGTQSWINNFSSKCFGIGECNPQATLHVGGTSIFDDNITLTNDKKVIFGDAGEHIVGDGTKITIASSNSITLDAVTDIILDADGIGGGGGGDIILKDGGTQYGRIENNGGNIAIANYTSGWHNIIEASGNNNVTMPGNVTVGGDVTLANDKKVIFGDAGENIVGDGTDLTVSTSNDIIVDATRDIILDGGQSTKFKDDGSLFFSISNSAGIRLTSQISDNDILFRGNDGGSFITALTLDMSEAGAAIFNSDVTVGGNLTINGTTTTLNTATLDIEDKTLCIAKGAADAAAANGAGIIVDGASACLCYTSGTDSWDFNKDVILPNNKKVIFGDAGEYIVGDGTNLNIVSSNALGIDVPNGITLDSGSGGTTLRAGGGTTYGTLTSNSGDLSINQTTSNKDIIFTGNDAGTTITPLKLDMSAGGLVTTDVAGSTVAKWQRDSSTNGELTLGFPAGKATFSSNTHFALNAGGGGNICLNHKTVVTGGAVVNGGLAINGEQSNAWAGSHNLVVRETSGDGGIAIISSSTSNNGNIAFADSAGGAFSDIGGLITYLHNGDSFRFMTANAERMRLNATGLGIGTSAPSTKLHLDIGTDNLGLYQNSTDATSGFALADNGGSINLATTSSGAFRIMTGGDANTPADGSSEAMRITSAGLVGIGTTSPQTTLHIAAGIPKIRIEDTDLSGMFFDIRGASSEIVFDLDPNSSQGLPNYSFDIGGSTKMRLRGNGRLGIGTTTPSQTLDVVGNAEINGTIFNNGKTMIRKDGASESEHLTIVNETAGSNSSPSHTDILFAGYSGKDRARIRVEDRSTNKVGGYMELATGTSTTDSTDGSALRRRIFIDRFGDVNFYEDTGTTPKVHWDAVNERFGIGNSVPVTPLHVGGTDTGSAGSIGKNIFSSQDFSTTYSGGAANTWSGLQLMNHDDTSNRTATGVTFVHRSSSSGIAGIISTSAAADRADIRFITRGSGNTIAERVIIDNDGKVGIGTSSPSRALTVSGSTSPFIAIVETGTSGSATLSFGDSSADNVGKIQYSNSTNSLAFVVNSSERMNIANSGRVGIGVNSPSGLLHVQSASSGASVNSSGDEIIAENSDNAGISILSGTSNVGSLFFGDSGDNNRGSVQYLHASNDMRFMTNGNVEKMRILSDGKVGIGTSAPTLPLEVSGSALIGGQIIATGSTTTTASRRAIMTHDGSSMKLLASGDSTHRNMIFYRDGGDDETMRIDTSGRLGIGTSSPETLLHLSSASPVITFQETDQSNRKFQIGSFGNAYAIYDATNTQYRYILDNAGNHIFNEGSQDSDFRIEGDNETHSFFVEGSTGRVKMNTSSSSSPQPTLEITSFGGTLPSLTLHGGTSTSSGSILIFRNGSGGEVGSVNMGNLNAGSSVNFTTSSDYRLKENVNYNFDATTRLKQLKPARFNFIADADTTVDGFIAHEVQSIIPEAISGEKDAVDEDGNPKYQGIDQSKLVPLLVKTIQELEARIKALEDV